ncbi:TetR/AcrR family transcriptional regulator [Humibacter antri]
MDDVAKAAHISRPGLYFLFDSKPALFREAITHALDRDLDLIARELNASNRSLSARLTAAFDIWGSSYIGPLSRDVPRAVDADSSLLGSVLDDAPQRFEELVVEAITTTSPADSVARTRTLISASIGIKYQVTTREEYLDRITVAVGLLLQ